MAETEMRNYELKGSDRLPRSVNTVELTWNGASSRMYNKMGRRGARSTVNRL